MLQQQGLLAGTMGNYRALLPFGITVRLALKHVKLSELLLVESFLLEWRDVGCLPGKDGCAQLSSWPIPLLLLLQFPLVQW